MANLIQRPNETKYIQLNNGSYAPEGSDIPAWLMPTNAVAGALPAPTAPQASNSAATYVFPQSIPVATRPNYSGADISHPTVPDAVSNAKIAAVTGLPGGMFDKDFFSGAAYAPAGYAGYNGKLVPTVQIGGKTFEDHTQETLSEYYASKRGWQPPTTLSGRENRALDKQRKLAAERNTYMINRTNQMIIDAQPKPGYYNPATGATGVSKKDSMHTVYNAGVWWNK